VTAPEDIIVQLRTTLAEHEGLSRMLETSVRRARERAEADLDPDLFDALDWPGDLDEYEQYLRGFLRWIPQESGARAWHKQDGGTSSSREISDRLAHFFWLIDQKDGDDGRAIGESSAAFRQCCTAYAREWGAFLDTPESFSQNILDSFTTNSPEFTVGESLVGGRPNAPSGWLSFNQFFARELNTGLRPITDPASNLVVTSPADCTFQHTYDIGERSEIPPTTLKGIHTYGTIGQLLEGSRYAGTFAGGTFAHYMLPPWAYHRFHLPVSGRVEESFVIQGTVVLEVDLVEHEFDLQRRHDHRLRVFPDPRGAHPRHHRLTGGRRRHRRCRPGGDVPRRLGGAHRGRGHPGEQGRRVRLLPIRRVRHHPAVPSGRRHPGRHQHQPPTRRLPRRTLPAHHPLTR